MHVASIEGKGQSSGNRLADVLPYVCLYALTASCIASPVLLGFWPTVRLAIIAAGLWWVVGRKSKPHVLRGHWPLLLVYLTGLFVLTQFAGESSGQALDIARRGIVVLGLGGLLLRAKAVPEQHSRTPKLDRWMMAIVACVVVPFLANLVFNDRVGDVAIESGVELAVYASLYILVSRLDWSRDGTLRSHRQFVLVSASAFACVVSVGTLRVCWIAYDAAQSSQALLAGDHERAAGQLARARRHNSGFGLPGHGIQQLLDAMADEVSRHSDRLATNMALGDIARSHDVLDRAVASYQRATQLSPPNSLAHTKLASALAARGDWNDARAAYHQGIGLFPDNSMQYLNFAVFLSRMYSAGHVREREAVVNLEKWFVRSSVSGELMKAPPGIAVYELSEILNESELVAVSRLSAANFVSFFRSKRWPVLFAVMEIGATGVKTPSDIRAYSAGGGNWSFESILVNGVEVSPPMKGTYSGFRRGLNVVIVDQTSGAVDSRTNFDTWGNRHVAPTEFIRHIDSIAPGKIVIVTVRNDGGKFQPKSMVQSFQSIGATLSTRPWWSHAVIGVKGAAPGTAMEVTARDSHVALELNAGGRPAEDAETARRAVVAALSESSSAPVAAYVTQQITSSLIAVRGRALTGSTTR